MVSCSIIICINTFFNTREKILDFSSYSIYVLFPSQFCRSRSQRSTQGSLDLSLYTATFSSSFIGTSQMSGQEQRLSSKWTILLSHSLFNGLMHHPITADTAPLVLWNSSHGCIMDWVAIKGEDHSQNSKRFQIINNYSFYCMLIFFLFYYLSIRGTFTTCTIYRFTHIHANTFFYF